MFNTLHSVDKMQRLRLQRTLWGFVTQLGLVLILISAAALDLIEPMRVVHVGLAITAFTLVFMSLIHSDLNLRFRDPSMTVLQVMVTLLPAVYAMYHLVDPQVRVSVMLMATVGMLFATLACDTRKLFGLAAYYVVWYGLVVAALATWQPERVNLTAELPVLLAYSVVLILICLLGGFIAGLRAKLKQRNARLNETLSELHELAIRDPLTRLPNRRAVMEHLALETSRTERSDPIHRCLCIGVLDVDHFKGVNDVHGHQTGDVVLCRISEALRETLRQGDFVGRFGGEEFLLVFPESSPEGGHMAAERVRRAIEALPIPELPRDARVTVSIGVAVHRPGDSMDTTLRRADDALYRAKEAGRNRTMISEPRAYAEG